MGGIDLIFLFREIDQVQNVFLGQRVGLLLVGRGSRCFGTLRDRPGIAEKGGRAIAERADHDITVLFRKFLKLPVGARERRIFTLAAAMKDDDQRHGGFAVVCCRDVEPVRTGLARFGEIVLGVHFAGEGLWLGAVAPAFPRPAAGACANRGTTAAKTVEAKTVKLKCRME